jgi:hypothetical protein
MPRHNSQGSAQRASAQTREDRQPVPDEINQTCGKAAERLLPFSVPEKFYSVGRLTKKEKPGSKLPGLLRRDWD